jgi:hypothetical protein
MLPPTLPTDLKLLCTLQQTLAHSTDAVYPLACPLSANSAHGPELLLAAADLQHPCSFQQERVFKRRLS